MYKILVFILFPLVLNGTTIYKEMPLQSERLSDLNSRFIYSFKDWEEMRLDPEISVEEYRKYIGTRCVGLYDYLDERDKQNIYLTVSLEDKVEFMEAVIKYNLLWMNKADEEQEQKWVLAERIGFKFYYRNLFQHQDKYFTKLQTLTNDIEFCESYFNENIVK